jgi:hypothetical protein
MYSPGDYARRNQNVRETDVREALVNGENTCILPFGELTR